ncbi:hypothetical protein [Neobacillus mesonae]|uniref:hypothetical protein n=1 Tax=Neobacillus mesonae TaxID=1193713 RepID=UPI0025748B25|nr:hypothetical protein [Neobacillus mesonae]
MEIEEIYNILKNSEEMADYEILEVKKRKNYSVTFVKHNNMKDDLSRLYKGLARILYKQAH